MTDQQEIPDVVIAIKAKPLIESLRRAADTAALGWGDNACAQLDVIVAVLIDEAEKRAR